MGWLMAATRPTTFQLYCCLLSGLLSPCGRWQGLGQMIDGWERYRQGAWTDDWWVGEVQARGLSSVSVCWRRRPACQQSNPGEGLILRGAKQALSYSLSTTESPEGIRLYMSFWIDPETGWNKWFQGHIRGGKLQSFHLLLQERRDVGMDVLDMVSKLMWSLKWKGKRSRNVTITDPVTVIQWSSFSKLGNRKKAANFLNKSVLKASHCQP